MSIANNITRIQNNISAAYTTAVSYNQHTPKSLWDYTSDELSNLVSGIAKNSIVDVLQNQGKPRKLEDPEGKISEINVSLNTLATTVTDVYLPNLTHIGKSNFKDFINLSSFVAPNLQQFGATECFRGCSSLTSLSLPSYRSQSSQSVGTSNFINGCTNLQYLNVSQCNQADLLNPGSLLSNLLSIDFSDRTRSSIPSFAYANNATTLSSRLPNAKIYVPESLYETWCNATNWTILSSKIVSVPDKKITVELKDGTIKELKATDLNSNNRTYYIPDSDLVTRIDDPHGILFYIGRRQSSGTTSQNPRLGSLRSINAKNLRQNIYTDSVTAGGNYYNANFNLSSVYVDNDLYKTINGDVYSADGSKLYFIQATRIGNDETVYENTEAKQLYSFYSFYNYYNPPTTSPIPRIKQISLPNLEAIPLYFNYFSDNLLMNTDQDEYNFEKLLYSRTTIGSSHSQFILSKPKKVSIPNILQLRSISAGTTGSTLIVDFSKRIFNTIPLYNDLHTDDQINNIYTLPDNLKLEVWVPARLYDAWVNDPRWKKAFNGRYIIAK